MDSPTKASNKRMQTDVAFGHAADAKRHSEQLNHG
jgi:hypothetical protein